MEVILWFFVIAIVAGGLAEVFDAGKDWYLSINWLMLFSVLIGGSLLLALIFSFTSEGVLVIIGAYIVLIIISLFIGKFNHNPKKKKKKKKKNL